MALRIHGGCHQAVLTFPTVGRSVAARGIANAAPRPDLRDGGRAAVRLLFALSAAWSTSKLCRDRGWRHRCSRDRGAQMLDRKYLTAEEVAERYRGALSIGTLRNWRLFSPALALPSR
jgi:hypothetical protein